MKKILLLLAIGLIGCTEKAPECGSDLAQDLVIQIIEPKMLKYYDYMFTMSVINGESKLKREEITNQVHNEQANILMVDSKPRLEMIITHDSDDKTLSSLCSAHITDNLNGDVLNIEYALNTSSDDKLVARVRTNRD